MPSQMSNMSKVKSQKPEVKSRKAKVKSQKCQMPKKHKIFSNIRNVKSLQNVKCQKRQISNGKCRNHKNNLKNTLKNQTCQTYQRNVKNVHTFQMSNATKYQIYKISNTTETVTCDTSPVTLSPCNIYMYISVWIYIFIYECIYRYVYRLLLGIHMVPHQV